MDNLRSYIISGILCLLAVSVQAQLCSGSLGDPTVHITFGSGPNPGPGASKNNYTYVNTDCPNDGSYTIRNSTSSCFGNTWHSIGQDHTPNDVNGYFMLVNASLAPGVFYMDTVGGLCEGTTYEFAAWIVNVLRPDACNFAGTQPNLTFDIETTTGTKLATYQTGNIPSTSTSQWKQYGVFFTTPVGISKVVIRLTNNAPGGCGNDLALDDITFRPCGPVVQAQIQGGSLQVDLCEGDTQIFQFNSNTGSGYVNPVYQWQYSLDTGKNWTSIPGATTPLYTRQPTGPGNFLYRLKVTETANSSNSSCGVASNLINIFVHGLPDTRASVQEPVCFGKAMILSAHDADQFSWTGPGGFTASDSVVQVGQVSFANSGNYYVHAVSAYGCMMDDTVLVNVNANPVASAGTDQTICEGSPVILQGSGGVQYSWSPASGLSSATIGQPLANPADSTHYLLTVANAAGCTDTASVNVNVLRIPKANAGPDKKLMEGDQVILEGNASGTGITYYWEPPLYLNDISVLQPVASPVSDITYTLHVISTLGCGSASDKVFVRVFKEVKIPNAFSPNGDGINDTWNILDLDTYPEADLKVFNRYGQPVYASKGYPQPWNGTYKGSPLPVGTYYYVIDIKNDFPLIKGSVTILR